VIGGKALQLLSKKHNLNTAILSPNDVQDLDILVPSSVESFFQKTCNATITTNKFFKRFTPVYLTEKIKIDILVELRCRNIVINNQTIAGVNYKKIIEYCYFDALYDVPVTVLNIYAYYGMVKSCGEAKYKDILDEIVRVVPDVKEKIVA
jgi:hypothetical protein